MDWSFRGQCSFLAIVVFFGKTLQLITLTLPPSTPGAFRQLSNYARRWRAGWGRGRDSNTSRLVTPWPAGIAQWWEHALPTNVAWVRSSYPMGWVCVGSHPCSEGFSLGSPVFLPPHISKFQFDLETVEKKSHYVDFHWNSHLFYFLFTSCYRNQS